MNELNYNKENGLSKSQAKEKLLEYGRNEIDSHKVTWFDILKRQFKSAFIYLLFGAALIAIAVGEQLDALIIFLFIVINTVLGFFQEYKTENTLKMLKTYISSFSKVIREGKTQQIPTDEIVPGDIVILEIGDRVPADMKILQEHNLTLDESILTGESLPVNKTIEELQDEKKDTITSSNMVYSGSSVVNGSAKCLVIATGQRTSFGKIAQLTLDTEKVSSFEKTLAKFSSFILKIVSVTILLLFSINLIFRPGVSDIPTLLIFTIALAVSVIPQALPLVMTFSLSRGSAILAKKKVAVKRLSAIEELGSLNILCTDKTGTITENRLEVIDTFANSKSELLTYANLAASLVEGKSIEPFDMALWDAISQEEKNTLKDFERIKYLPFNPALRRNGVLVSKGKEERIVFRGAVESVLTKCSISKKKKAEIVKWVGKKEERGMRCLAVAKRVFKKNEDVEKIWVEGNLTFIGVVAFEDPVKESTYEAVKRAKELGIELKVITGDSKRVASWVAFDIGLTKKDTNIITGLEFKELNDVEKRKAAESKKVFARFTPEQKYEIMKILGEKNYTGFLGDGINDAPALKVSNVSLVVSNSSDIAREAADIVLLEKDLQVIVDGIYEGRKVFANTIKYLTLTLAANFGNFYAVAIASLFIDFLPMLPLQILLLNLLSDFPMIAVATDYVDQEVLLKPRKYKVKDILVVSTILGLVSTVFDFVFFFFFYKISPAVLQTSWFIGSVLTELVFIFSIRTRKFFLSSIKPSKTLTSLALIAAVITIILPFLTIGQRYFQFERPTYENLFIIIAIVIAYFIATEAVKVFYYRKENKEDGY